MQEGKSIMKTSHTFTTTVDLLLKNKLLLLQGWPISKSFMSRPTGGFLGQVMVCDLDIQLQRCHRLVRCFCCETCQELVYPNFLAL